jgi:uncharacterized protein YggT (Ycf19 family)
MRFARSGAAGGTADAPPMRPAGTSGFMLGLQRLGRDLLLRLQQLVGLVFLVVEAIVALRIIFKAMGANETAGFASFIYSLSSPFVGPFHPVFKDGNINGHPFELGSLLAMLIFAALAFLALRVVRVVFSPKL